ncbi:YggS family pyridoxal phosphate-dependent enzyme [Numidum massiliense]|uniref:YggS family pyridoxal phosphate-dependent enzyme n=1 Tax=Numidum massiliense TaxID=1522315 RepID=UPI0006D54FFE|nr:YggS family pyridoxal phosphate-dependent enzyme [Numidum massiliense]
MNKETLEQNYRAVTANIQQACKRSGRSPDEVGVIAVTKYVGIETTEAVLDLGVGHIGESRAQEAVPKWEALGNRGTWHFIGHLQRNKVKDVVGRFTYIHSLDRFSLAQEISKRAAQKEVTVRALLQVNVAGEESKFGLSPDEVVEFSREVAALPHLTVAGLMTMAPHVPNSEEVRPIFRELRALRDKLDTYRGASEKQLELSMGMSNDYEVAVEEGATMVRVGSSLVGRER